VFLSEHDPTIEEMHSSKLDVDGRSVDLHLVDTSGADDFESMWPNVPRCVTRPHAWQWFQAVQGALLVYAVDDADSFAALPTFSKAIRAWVHLPTDANAHTGPIVSGLLLS